MRHLVGDPTVLGWTITLGFGVASGTALCAFALQPKRARERALWLCLGLALGFLALNKQLDLQVTLDHVGRSLARAQGWYQDRDVVKVAFLLLLTAVVAEGLGLLAWLSWPWSRPSGAALAGATVIATHVLLRAASLELFDIRDLLGGWNFYPILELVGIAVVAASASLELRTRLQAAG
jgi:hypothetical protein